MRWWLVLIIVFLAASVWLVATPPVVNTPTGVPAIATPTAVVTPLANVQAQPSVTPSARPDVNIATPLATPASLSTSEQLNQLLQATLTQTGSAYRSSWRQIWPLSRQRDAFDERERTQDLLVQGLIEHGWQNGQSYLALAGAMADVDLYARVLTTYWQGNVQLDASNWPNTLTLLATMQAGQKQAYAAESQAFCQALAVISELAVASCGGQLLDQHSILALLTRLEDDEAKRALIGQALQQTSNLDIQFLEQIKAYRQDPLMAAAMVAGLASLPTEYLRRPEVNQFIRQEISQAQLPSDVLDHHTRLSHQYHRLYLQAVGSANITDAWLSLASSEGNAFELMMHAQQRILLSQGQPGRNKLTDDVNRFILRLYELPVVLSALDESIAQCQAQGGTDQQGRQILSLVSIQSPTRESTFNQGYRQLFRCHQG